MGDEGWGIRIPVEKASSRRQKQPSAASEPTRVVLGFDPGVSGACVALSLVADHARFWRIRPKRIDGFPVMDIAAMARNFKVKPVAFVEHVKGRGGWGAQSNFAFGAIAGGTISAMRQYGWEIRLVRPQVWQKRIHDIPGPFLDPKLSAKEKSLAAYNYLFPLNPLPLNQVGDPEHNSIDALLIAYYGLLELGGKPRAWKFNKGGD